MAFFSAVTQQSLGPVARRLGQTLVGGVALLTAGGLLLLAGCGSDDVKPSASTSGGQGGSGGSSVVVDPLAKPECADTSLPVGSVPMARSDTAGAMSTDGHSMLLFGGDQSVVICGEIPAREHVADTWLLDLSCGAWKELPTTSAPSARARHSVAADKSRDRALLFGGRFRDNAATSGAYTLFADVWAFDFATQTWGELATSGDAPSARANSAAVVVGNELIVFGGNTSTSGLNFAPNNDSYALDLDTNVWRVLVAPSPPPARLFHTMTYDPDEGRLFVVSGGDENAFVGPFLNDVWALDMATLTWHEIPTAGLVDLEIGRIKAGLVYRSATETLPAALIAFGGHDSAAVGIRNDVQVLDLSGLSLPPSGPAQWSTPRPGDTFNSPGTGQCMFPADFVLTDLEAPERRQGFAIGAIDGGGAFVVIAGDSDCGRLSDSWWYHSGEATWTPVREALPGLTCPRTQNPSCQSLCN